MHFKEDLAHARNVKNAFMPKTSISSPNGRCFVLQVLKNEGTVKAAPNFNASEDAAVLDKAIKVKGDHRRSLYDAVEHVESCLNYLVGLCSTQSDLPASDIVNTVYC